MNNETNEPQTKTLHILPVELRESNRFITIETKLVSSSTKTCDSILKIFVNVISTVPDERSGTLTVFDEYHIVCLNFCDASDKVPTCFCARAKRTRIPSANWS